MGGIRPIDQQIQTLARRQGGYVERRQLAALGLSRHAIEHRIATGQLLAAHRAVYAVGHVPTHPLARARGALLAAGPDSVLSHGSAASLWGAFSDWRLPFELSSPHDRRPGGLIVVHRNTRLAPDEIRTHYGIRATSPALTMLDVASRLTDRRLQRAVDDLRLGARQLTLEQLEDTVARYPRHPGAKAIHRILGTAEREPTRSPWEQDWRPFAQRHRLAPHETNVHVCGHRVDVYFPAERVIVELDGWDTHRTHAAFVADRDRDAEILAATGILTVRLTRAGFRRRPSQEAKRLQSILERRRRRPAA